MHSCTHTCTLIDALPQTMNSIEGEEAKMENVFNLVDELDWLKTDLLAQHCGDEVAMPLLVSCDLADVRV